MHAALDVSIIDPQGFTTMSRYAWKVEIDHHGKVLVHLADPDAEGHMPAGQEQLDVQTGETLEIKADW